MNEPITALPINETELGEAPGDVEVPDVFTLPPLSSRRATAKVLQVRAAQFTFIAEDEAPDACEDEQAYG